MNSYKLHNSLINKRGPLLITLLFFLVVRFFALRGDFTVELVVTTLVQVGIAFLLLYFNQLFVIIQQRTLLPAFFFLLFSATLPMFYFTMSGSISALLVLFCLFILLTSYQQRHSQLRALNIALLLTLGSFLWQGMIFFFPIFWYGMYKYQSLNTKTFFAGLAGVFVIYLFAFTISVFLDDQFAFFTSLLPDFNALFQITLFGDTTLYEYLTLGFAIVLFIITGFNLFVRDVSEKIVTIVTLGFLYTVSVALFIVLVLQAQWKNEWASALCMLLSFLFSHLFTLSNKRIYSWLLFITILFFLFIFVAERFQIF